MDKLGTPQRRMLDLLVEAFPDPIGREDLADRVGYHQRTKAFINGLGRMRSMGLVDYPGSGLVVATELLFPPGLA